MRCSQSTTAPNLQPGVCHTFRPNVDSGVLTGGLLVEPMQQAFKQHLFSQIGKDLQFIVFAISLSPQRRKLNGDVALIIVSHL